MSNNADLSFTIKADDRASKVIEGVADDVERLEGSDATVKLTATDKASQEIDAVIKRVDSLDKDTATVILNAEAKKAQSEIDQLTRLLGKVDGEEALVVLEARDDATAKLGKITGKIREVEQMSPVEVDVEEGKGFGSLFDKLDAAPGKIGEIAGSLGELGGGAMGIAAGAGAIATALFAAGQEAANTALQANSLATYIGMSVEESSKLLAVLETVGIEQGDLKDIIGQVNGVLSQQPELAKRLGIELKGAAPGEVFLRAYDAISALEDPTQRLMLMQQAFGEEGARQVGDLVARYGDLRQAMGDIKGVRVVTPEDVKKAKEFQKAMADLTVQLQEMALTAGENVLPALTKLVELAGLLPGAVGANAGIGVDQWAKSLRDAGASLDEVTDMAKDLGLTVEETNSFMVAAGVTTAAGANYAAQAAAAYAQQTTAIEATAFSLDDLNAKMATAKQAAADEQASTEANSAAHRDNVAALNEQITAYRSAADSTFALNEANATQATLLAELPKKLQDAGGDWHKIRAVLDDVVQSSAKVADASVRVADEQAKAAGKTLSARDKLDLWNTSALTQAQTLKGPARTALLDYIATVNGIPPEQLTDVKAQLDTGSVETAQTALNGLSAARTAAITADVEKRQAETDLNNLTKPRTVKVTVKSAGRIGTHMVDEAETEIGAGVLTMPAARGGFGTEGTAAPAALLGGTAYDAATGALVAVPPVAARPVAGAPVATPTDQRPVTINVTVPRGYRDLDAATAAHRLAKRSGRLYAGRR